MMHVREQFLRIGLELFGDDAEAAARFIFGRIRIGGHFAHNHVAFDDDGDHGPKNTIWRVNLRPDASQLTLAHEFGHVMHCFHWPERSATAGQWVAERAATWAEGRFVHQLVGGEEFVTWVHGKPASVAPGPGRSAAVWLRDVGFLEYPVETPRALDGLMGVFHAAA